MESIYNRVIRIAGGNAYFFDEKGVYTKIRVEEAFNRALTGIEKDYEKYWLTDPGYWKGVKECDAYNGNRVILRKAITSLKEGETFEDFKEKLRNTELESHPFPEGIDRFITKIGIPKMERQVGNNDPNTFDFIRVEVHTIGRQFWKNHDKYLKNHIKEISNRVVEKIKKSKRFIKYGVPVNFLKLTSLTYYNGYILEFIFELKKF